MHVLAFVIENEVSALRVATHVRSKHDVVGSGVAEGRGVAHLRTNLHIAAAALNVLFILGLVLDDEVLQAAENNKNNQQETDTINKTKTNQ